MVRVNESSCAQSIDKPNDNSEVNQILVIELGH